MSSPAYLYEEVNECEEVWDKSFVRFLTVCLGGISLELGISVSEYMLCVGRRKGSKGRA